MNKQAMAEFESNTQQQLRQSEQVLDDDILLSLRAARENALSKPKRFQLPSFLLPATGMVAASMVAMVLVYSPINGPTTNENDILSVESIELYEELDFYHWLATQDGQLSG